MKTGSTASSIRVRRNLRGTPGRMSLETDSSDARCPFAQPNVLDRRQRRSLDRRSRSIRICSTKWRTCWTKRCEVARAKAARRSSWIRGRVRFWRWPIRPTTTCATSDRFSARRAPRSRGHGRLRAGLDVQADHGRRGARQRQGDDGLAFPARDEIEVGGARHPQRRGRFDGLGAAARRRSRRSSRYSHNVGAAEVGLRDRAATLYARCARSASAARPVSTCRAKIRASFPRSRTGARRRLPTMSFGHGIAVTPLALARAYARSRTAACCCGRASSRRSSAGRTRRLSLRPEIERRVMSEKTAATLRVLHARGRVRGTGNPTARKSPATRPREKPAPRRSPKTARTPRASTSHRSSERAGRVAALRHPRQDRAPRGRDLWQRRRGTGLCGNREASRCCTQGSCRGSPLGPPLHGVEVPDYDRGPASHHSMAPLVAALGGARVSGTLPSVP
jgi:hypothetical protein